MEFTAKPSFRLKRHRCDVCVCMRIRRYSYQSMTDVNTDSSTCLDGVEGPEEWY